MTRLIGMQGVPCAWCGGRTVPVMQTKNLTVLKCTMKNCESYRNVPAGDKQK